MTAETPDGDQYVTVRELIFQGVRQWMIEVNNLAQSGDVINAREKESKRPPQPYVSVNVAKANQPTFDESIPGSNATHVTHQNHGGRMANVTCQGFGIETDDWLERTQSSLRNDAISNFLANRGLTVRRMSGGIDEVTELIDGDFEPRFVIEFRAAYRLVTEEVETFVGAEHLDLKLDLKDDSKGDTLAADMTLDL